MGMSASSDSPEIKSHVHDVIVVPLVQPGFFELSIGIGLGLVDGGFHHVVDIVLGVLIWFGRHDLIIFLMSS